MKKITNDYGKHIGKLKKVDLSEYDNSTEKFFEEQYRKWCTNLSEEEIKDAYYYAETDEYRKNSGPWEYLFFDICYCFDRMISTML